MILLRYMICMGVISLTFFSDPVVSRANESTLGRHSGISDIIFKLERMRYRALEDIRKYEIDIHKNETTINKAKDIIRQAQQKGNAQAEKIARDALTTAQEAKRKNEETKRQAELNKNRVDSAIDYIQRGGAEPEARLEQVEYANMNDRWVLNQRHLIEQRLKDPNPYASKIYRSLRANAPPPPTEKNYNNLQPGDVLLFSPDDTKSFLTNLGDILSSATPSPAAHTVLYLKEVNGKKLFLDNTPEKGSHVISEDEFLRTYSRRDALLASVAQPLTKDEADKLWDAARERIMKESVIQQKKDGNIVDQTGYGLFGNDNMVCSETSRWALVQAGRNIPESGSPLKRLLGIHYGPANFFSDDYNFMITPLWTDQNR